MCFVVVVSIMKLFYSGQRQFLKIIHSMKSVRWKKIIYTGDTCSLLNIWHQHVILSKNTVVLCHMMLTFWGVTIMTGLIITLTNINGYSYEETIFYMLTGKFSSGEIVSLKAYPKALLLIVLRNIANVDLKY